MALNIRTHSGKLAATCLLFSLNNSAYSLSFDGEGHYGLKGEARTKPGMATDRGLHQAVEQSFRLLGEARLNDKSSFFMELRLFDDPRNAYLGDQARPQECENGSGPGKCSSAHQNVRDPGYKPYTPHVTKAYARYAFDYCILEAGRRGRSWGMGMFLDEGKDPFSTGASIFDGVSCDINIQKTQALGISFGYDKLAETSQAIRPDSSGISVTHGPDNIHDDISQFFLTIEYDDRKANAGSMFTKQIGIYGAKVSSPATKKGGSNTDLTFVDLYTAFYYSSFSLKNEVLFTLGKTADPNATYLGGSFSDASDDNGIATNDMSSIAFTGEFAWKVASSGSHIGPEIYRQGDASSHTVFADYAFAPGNSKGYYNDTREDNAANSDARLQALKVSKRDKNANAVAFHRNFKPALIMFNGHSQLDDMRVDGIFDPGRLMNAQVYSIGYRYEDLSIGDFEVKGIYGSLNEGMPADVEEYYRTQEKKPVGFYGTDLGFELDVSYSTYFGKDVSLGLAAGALFAGKAYRTSDEDKAQTNYLLQSSISFNF